MLKIHLLLTLALLALAQERIDVYVDDPPKHECETWTMTIYEYTTAYSSTVDTVIPISTLSLTFTTFITTLTVFEIEGTTVTTTAIETVSGSTTSVVSTTSTESITGTVTETTKAVVSMTTVTVVFSTASDYSVITVSKTETETVTRGCRVTTVTEYTTKRVPVTRTVRRHCHPTVCVGASDSDPIVSDQEDLSRDITDPIPIDDPGLNGGFVPNGPIVV